MEDSEKMLDVAETTDGIVEETTDVTEEITETNDNEEFDDTNVESEDNTNNDENDDDTSENDKTQTQTKEDNSKYAQARRKAEAEFKKKEAEAFKRGKFEAYKGKLNPYTNTSIEDDEDLEVYEAMCEIANKGGDPVTDFAQYTATKKREEKKALEEKNKLSEEAKQDIEDFSKKYPDIDLQELLDNEDFKDYIEGKRKPLVQLYDSYKRLENKFRTNGVDIAKKTIANSVASPGSLNGGGENSIDFNTMSDAEFEVYLDKVKSGEIK